MIDRFVGVQDAPLMLSVSGARGVVGKTMTAVVARNFAAAFAAHIRQTLTANARDGNAGAAETRAIMVIGRDGRGSGEALAQAASDGLCAQGFDVVDLGIVATPTVGLMIGYLGAVGGISLTASHNPIEWNGLKTLNADGLALPADAAEQVIARYRRGSTVPAGNLGRRSLNSDGDRLHVERVLAAVDVAAIRAKRFRCALDSVNGSGARAGRMLLETLGCEVLHLNGNHTGVFAHTPEPLEVNLGQLMDAVRVDGNFAVGFAQDPDADRLALVDERGRFVGEEYTLVLGVLRLLQRQGHGVLATNLSTSRMIDDVAARFPPSRVIRTAVGEANVVAALKAGDGYCGGEGNGGLIWPRICWVRDSLSAMALVLELLAHDGRLLSSIAAEIPAYSMIKRKMDLAAVGGRSAVAPALAKVVDSFASRAGVRVDQTDGVRIDFADRWVHLRASNTEPIIRLIAEASDRAAAEALCDACSDAAGFRSP
ncbi:MAG: phosphoglucosamine mutase [Phycisphaerales bacterium]|nr:phosphoglucosamine mutase [Phycisphaerales bacterium]